VTICETFFPEKREDYSKIKEEGKIESKREK
jgi:hypothetical protein